MGTNPMTPLAVFETVRALRNGPPFRRAADERPAFGPVRDTLAFAFVLNDVFGRTILRGGKPTAR